MKLRSYLEVKLFSYQIFSKLVKYSRVKEQKFIFRLTWLLLDDDEGLVLVHLALLPAPLLLLVARRRGLLTVGLFLKVKLQIA